MFIHNIQTSPKDVRASFDKNKIAVLNEKESSPRLIQRIGYSPLILKKTSNKQQTTFSFNLRTSAHLLNAS